MASNLAFPPKSSTIEYDVTIGENIVCFALQSCAAAAERCNTALRDEVWWAAQCLRISDERHDMKRVVIVRAEFLAVGHLCKCARSRVHVRPRACARARRRRVSRACGTVLQRRPCRSRPLQQTQRVHHVAHSGGGTGACIRLHPDGCGRDCATPKAGWPIFCHP